MTSTPVPPPPPQATAQLHIPGVRLLDVIGRGGFATVYGGVQESMARPVAVKIDSRPLSDERNRRRYLREVQAAGRITGHPHVVSLIDTGVLPDDRPFIVMERCDGGSLVDLVARGPVAPADAVALVRAAASALGAAHDAGVLHRDVKPANILLDSYGSPRLTDFGIAAVEREGQDPTVTLECLTPDFAPPEAFALSTPGPSGDVWSMGAVLFFLLTGRGPRRGLDGSVRSLPEIVRDLDTPVRLDEPVIPAEIRPVLARAMSRDPMERYRNGTELTEALAAIQDAMGNGDLTVAGPVVAVRLAEAGLLSGAAGSAPTAHTVALGSSSTPPAPQLLPAGARPGNPSAASVPVLSPEDSLAEERRVRRQTVAAAVLGFVAGLVLGALTGWAVPTLSSALGGSGLNDSAVQAASAQATGTAGTAAPAAQETDPSAQASTPPHAVGTCLGGIVSLSGISSASEVDCAQAHSWEVFATGTLDAATSGRTDAELEADPTVIATCTAEAARAYGISDPEVAVLGPSEVEWTVNGSRGFSCIATPA
ncbi:serine/threonine-protein kinase [Actinomyces howellii]|uniref:non-specific serine/threonine protein kinase n=1 Tax=Actinomyces howellii TaxID=52771 RepID=A0A448HF05_9ACTO|nr:Serine/threonine-protein kinase pknK [Actinomyces howellii]